jgi:FkbM family methyltransferase
MNLYENRLYKLIKKIYYLIISILFNKSGIDVKINQYRLKFFPLHYRWFPESSDSESFEYIRSYVNNNSVSIDVGAHFGLFTLVLAKYFNCKVYSFEPTPYTTSILKKNISFNKLNNAVTVIEKAVSKKDGKSTFLIQETDGAVSNSLIDYWHSNENKETIEVEVISIDSFFKEIKYDFIKIDAEGAEYDVLLGATNTIRINKPLILLAIHPSAIVANGNNLEQIWDWIINEGYTCNHKRYSITKEFFCSQINLFDLFLIHKEYKK